MKKTYKLNRLEAMNHCIALGEKFMHSFHNVYNHKNSENNKECIAQMSMCFKEAKNIILEEKDRPLLTIELMDWFFTAGSNYKIIINEFSEDEIVSYDKFITDLIYSHDVNLSLEKNIDNFDI